MRIIEPDLNINIDLEINKPFSLIIENRFSYSQLINQLWLLKIGDVNDFIISKADEELKFSKMGSLVFNPYEIDVNDKKVINRIYQELNDIAINDYIENTNKIKTEIVDYMETIINTVSYPLLYNMDIEIGMLLKLLSTKIDDSYETMLDKLISYVKLYHQVLSTKLFVFVGLKQYLSDEEIISFYDNLKYEDVYLLDIENRQYNILSVEKTVIIDDDNCRIDV